MYVNTMSILALTAASAAAALANLAGQARSPNLPGRASARVVYFARVAGKRGAHENMFSEHFTRLILLECSAGAATTGSIVKQLSLTRTDGSAGEWGTALWL